MNVGRAVLDAEAQAGQVCRRKRKRGEIRRRANNYVTREERVRCALEAMTDRKWPSTRALEWLVSPYGGHRRMELDCYCRSWEADEQYPLGTAVEVQGAQHSGYTRFMHESSTEYEEQVGRDVAKRALCKENGVRLLEVGHGVPDAELVLHLMELLFSPVIKI